VSWRVALNVFKRLPRTVEQNISQLVIISLFYFLQFGTQSENLSVSCTQLTYIMYISFNVS